MKRLAISIACVILIVLVAAQVGVVRASVAYTTLTASFIKDAGGNALGSGTITFTPVTTNGALTSSMGIMARGVTCLVSAGAITTQKNGTTCQAADALAANPTLCYSVTIQDTVTNAPVPTPGQLCAQPTGTTWSYDSYQPLNAAALQELNFPGSIGAVTTLAPGASATASLTGTPPTQQINFGIPQGLPGATGPAGPAGATGAVGPAGGSLSYPGVTTDSANGLAATGGLATGGTACPSGSPTGSVCINGQVVVPAAKNLLHFRAKMQATNAGTGNTVVCTLGDSTTHGFESSTNSADYFDNSYPASLANDLVNFDGIATSKDAWFGVGQSGNSGDLQDDPYLVAGSSWAADYTRWGPGGGMASATTSTNSLVWTTTGQGDTIVVLYPIDTNLGAGTVQLDAQTPVTITETGGSQSWGTTTLTSYGCCTGAFVYASGGSPSGSGAVTLSGFGSGCVGATATMLVSGGTPGAITFSSSGISCSAVPTTATCTSSTATCSGTMTFSGGALTNGIGTHTVTATRSTGTFTLMGEWAYNSSISQVIVKNLAVGGATMPQHNTTTGAYGTGNSGIWGPTGLACDVVIDESGINEWTQGTTLSSYSTAFQGVITAQKTAGADVVLLTPVPSQLTVASQAKQLTYVNAEKALAASNYNNNLPGLPLPVIDVNAQWGTYASRNASPYNWYYAASPYHPTGPCLGYQAIANSVEIALFAAPGQYFAINQCPYPPALPASSVSIYSNLLPDSDFKGNPLAANWTVQSGFTATSAGGVNGDNSLNYTLTGTSTTVWARTTNALNWQSGATYTAGFTVSAPAGTTGSANLKICSAQSGGACAGTTYENIFINLGAATLPYAGQVSLTFQSAFTTAYVFLEANGVTGSGTLTISEPFAALGTAARYIENDCGPGATVASGCTPAPGANPQQLRMASSVAANPAANTAYFVGAGGLGTRTAVTNQVPFAQVAAGCSVYAVNYWIMNGGTLGSSGDLVTFAIYATTGGTLSDTVLTTVPTQYAAAQAQLTAVSDALSAGETLVLKVISTNATWTTAPTQLYYGADVFCH